MNVRYSGSQEAILSVSAAWNRVLRDREGLWYTAKEDGTARTIEEVTICEGVWEQNSPLGFGQWRYTLNGSRVLIEGAELNSLVKAVWTFLKAMEQAKTEPISSDLVIKNKHFISTSDFSLGGTALSRYCIYYKQNEYKIKDSEDFLRVPSARMAADDLADYIGKKCGAYVVPLPLTNEANVENAIVISPFEEEKPYGNWQIKSQGSTLFILANDICGWESGISALCECFEQASNVPFPLSLCGSLQAREEYTENPDAFRPCYNRQWKKTPTSFEEKAKKLSDPTGDAFIIAHRGEHTYYPENSLEASLSAWKGNADATEVDLSLTRDGIFVLMHDDTLTRTTDVSEKRGKNGLPDSEILSDWSFDELRRLRLKDSYGRVTDFLIPSLEEIFKACNGKIFVHLDKKFDYKTDIFPLMRRLGTFQCLYLCNRLDYEGIVENKNEFSREGVVLQSLFRIPQMGLPRLELNLNRVLEANGEICPALVFINDYHKYLPHHKKLIRAYKGKLRIATWMMWETDSPYFWQEAADLGFNVFMTNFPLRLQKYFSEEI